MKFFFKHEYYGDDWHEFDGKARDHESVAMEVAKYKWYQDPCDPHKFEFECEIKDENQKIKRISVSAEADVNFYTEELSQKVSNDE